jgi:hypothetical protein
VGSKTLASIIPRLLLDSAPGNARVRLPATQPSRVVAVLDPQSGGRLLVGTQGAPGEAVLTERRQSAYIVEPSLQGVVVAATADDVRLKRETAGFLLITGPPGDGTKPGGDATEAATPWDMPVSQLLDIRNEPVESAAKELRQQILFAATAPAMTRSAPRVRVAETMVALAMGVEAQAVFNIAATDDPTLRDDPKVIGLRAVAAILAHRPDGAANLADPRLDGTNEIDLWRALQRVDQGQATDADGTALAKGLPVVLGYPPMLRERLLPATLEGMALNGQAPAAQAALTARPDDPSLELARGMVAEMTNRPDEALAAYDTVAGRADRLARTTALVRAVELRMKTGALDVSAGADALDRSLFSWRDGQQELPLRLRIAALRRNAGQFGQALTVLREGREAIPDARAKFDKEISATFDAMFAGDAVRRMAPADFVKLYDRNQDLMQAITWTEPVGLKLVDRLTELNLQGRAEPVLVRLVQQTTDPAHRTALGARLASLRLTMNDPAGAIAALSATVPPQGAATDPALIETRQLLYARAESERGNKDTALTMLSALSSAEADEARADILTARKDWPHAIAALTSLESKRIPPATSDLTADQQALIMRLAEAATLGSDSATLDRLATTYGDAMGKGSNAALFRLVTSAPIHGTKDLPRAFQEIQLTRQLPGKMAGGT